MSGSSVAKGVRHQRFKTVPHDTLVAEFFHLPHHVGNVLILLQKPVDFRDRGARAAGDAPPPRRVQKLGVAPLLLGHRRDDRFLALQEVLVDIGIGELLFIFPIPGSMPSMPPMPPMRRIWRNWAARSSRSKRPFAILAASFSASS